MIFRFCRKYGIKYMYLGGFYPFANNETKWAWWANIYFNKILSRLSVFIKSYFFLLENKNYFVITTNVDH